MHFDSYSSEPSAKRQRFERSPAASAFVNQMQAHASTSSAQPQQGQSGYYEDAQPEHVPRSKRLPYPYSKKFKKQLTKVELKKIRKEKREAKALRKKNRPPPSSEVQKKRIHKLKCKVLGCGFKMPDEELEKRKDNLAETRAYLERFLIENAKVKRVSQVTKKKMKELRGQIQATPKVVFQQDNFDPPPGATPEQIKFLKRKRRKERKKAFKEAKRLRREATQKKRAEREEKKKRRAENRIIREAEKLLIELEQKEAGEKGQKKEQQAATSQDPTPVEQPKEDDSDDSKEDDSSEEENNKEVDSKEDDDDDDDDEDSEEDGEDDDDSDEEEKVEKKPEISHDEDSTSSESSESDSDDDDDSDSDDE